MVEVMKIMVTSSEAPMQALLHSLSPTLQQATTDTCLHWRLPDTHRQVWVSPLWGHCSFLLGLGAHRFCSCVPRVCFPILCKFWWLSVQFSSVTQSCPTLCNPMNRSMPGLPIHHQLLEFTQTHVHRVGDAIQPSHPLLSPSPPAPNPSQHQRLFQ